MTYELSPFHQSNFFIQFLNCVFFKQNLLRHYVRSLFELKMCLSSQITFNISIRVEVVLQLLTLIIA